MGNPMWFFDDVCRETYRLLMEEGLIKKKKFRLMKFLLKKFVKQSKIVNTVQNSIFNAVLLHLASHQTFMKTKGVTN